jgi:hypothetical protein
VKDLLAMTSGLRDGELQGLAWSHIKLDGPIPYVQVDRQRHQNGKFAPPKKNSFRFIPLHDAARFALAWWKKEGWRLWTTKSPGENDAVFPNGKGGFWCPKSAAYFRTDLAIARQPTQYAGHDLDYHATRRSFSTYLENVGVTEDRVSELLGHAAEGTAKRHYIASSMAPKLEAIRQIDLSAVTLAWLGTNQTAVSPTKQAPQNPRSSQCARTDSNGRLSASKASQGRGQEGTEAEFTEVLAVSGSDSKTVVDPRGHVPTKVTNHTNQTRVKYSPPRLYALPPGIGRLAWEAAGVS